MQFKRSGIGESQQQPLLRATLAQTFVNRDLNHPLFSQYYMLLSSASKFLNQKSQVTP